MTTNNKQKMTGVNFIYWLQGSIELGEAKSFSKTQVKVIQEHLTITETHTFKDWLEGFLSTHQSGVNQKDFKVLQDKIETYLINVTKDIKLSELITKIDFPRTDWGSPGFPEPKKGLLCFDKNKPLSDQIIC